ncbi:hypothetical protein B0H14DRAFT_3523363 [Mycena olivaceomarginata]|nr:hypothetical protein B0H14DRAFT_3523363 [Mycena olivaceomarginata]
MSLLFSWPSCSSISSCSPSRAASTSSVPPRPNEHLAVLLPKHQWKSDNVGAQTPLLQVRWRLLPAVFVVYHHAARHDPPPFSQPPAQHPLTEFEFPASSIISARVCDDCFDQIHGLCSPDLVPRRPAPPSASTTPSPTTPPLPHTSILPTGSISRMCLSSPTHTDPHCCRGMRCPLSLHSMRGMPLAAKGEEERSYGKLNTYLLWHPSLLCKASSSGWWEPKPEAVDPVLRMPIISGKAPYELEMESEEAEEQRWRSNPVIWDGDFQYCFAAVCDPKPIRA